MSLPNVQRKIHDNIALKTNIKYYKCSVEYFWFKYKKTDNCLDKDIPMLSYIQSLYRYEKQINHEKPEHTVIQKCTKYYNQCRLHGKHCLFLCWRQAINLSVNMAEYYMGYFITGTT